jgi:DNA-directed RNA polymerase specialized sigma24 family protein
LFAVGVEIQMPEPVRTNASVETLLAAILAMLVAEREDQDSEPGNRRKSEVILNEAGLSAPEIATLVGKKPDAVRKTLQRAK